MDGRLFSCSEKNVEELQLKIDIHMMFDTIYHPMEYFM